MMPPAFRKLVSDKIDTINAAREQYVEAWYAKHGIPIENAVLVQQDMGDTVRVWVEVRHDFCQTHRAEISALKARILSLKEGGAEEHF